MLRKESPMLGTWPPVIGHIHEGERATDAAARELREAIGRELGELPMHAFLIGALPALQTTAENVFFDHHRHFADLDGSGDAGRAQSLSDALLQRLQRLQRR